MMTASGQPGEDILISPANLGAEAGAGLCTVMHLLDAEVFHTAAIWLPWQLTHSALK